METITETRNDDFIQANTKMVFPEILREETIIPAFAKDNESTISHVEFIDVVQDAVSRIFPGEAVSSPSVKVSHPIRGRVPEAKGKPAKDLFEHEKTLYYERMSFMMELPEIRGRVGADNLSLSVGGVRAYNHENLYNRKSPERFKVFIGFKNWVCTNLCVSTDGFLGDLRVQSTVELQGVVEELIARYDADNDLLRLRLLNEVSITKDQFSHIIGRAKLYIHMNSELRNDLEPFPLGDNQLTLMVKEFSVQHQEKINLSLWELYNLMTSANKSSYIDSFLDRNVGCLDFSLSLANALQNQIPSWYLIQ